MKEKDVWKKFKTSWPYHCDRQEPGIGSGQPDVIVLDRLGRIGLIELKAPDNVKLDPSQWIWHEQWNANNGITCVVSCQDYGRSVGLIWRVFRPLFHSRRLVEITEQPRDKPPLTAMRVIAFELGLRI